MDWEKDFYQKQFLWSKKYMDYDMETLKDDLIFKMQTFTDDDAKKVLGNLMILTC